MFSFEEKIDSYAEANISTEQPPPRQDARIPCPHGYEERPPRAQKAQGQGAQASHPFALLNGATLPQRAPLRSSAEYRKVYDNGRRYDGRLLSVFVLGNDVARHRLGITASRKMSLRAVGRNRAKRLIREAFRLSPADLDALRGRYDWVVNARRSILSAKMPLVLEEFRQIVARVRGDEPV